MMFANTLATCRSCGGDVPLLDLAAALPIEGGKVHLAWRHKACGHAEDRTVNRVDAIAIHQRLSGKEVRSADELLLDSWHNDLSGDLTLKVFEDHWNTNGKGGGWWSAAK